jgi:hypothetical protein
MDPAADSSHTINECGTLRQQAKAWAPASAGVSESFFFGFLLGLALFAVGFSVDFC